MSKEPEFAERYTPAEKIRMVILGALCGLMILLAAKWWFFPWFDHFVGTAPCRSVFGIDGVIVLWNGIFVGLPLLSSLLTAVVFGWRGYKILRDQQFPPLNEKVFEPTKIQRGRSAKRIGYLNLCPVIFFLALSIWGGFQVKDMSKFTAQDIKQHCD